MQQEQNASSVILDTKTDVVTIHYSTTTRSAWMENGFCWQDVQWSFHSIWLYRKDIAKLFAVTFNNHLTLTTNVEKSVLWWEKISTLMTDSVAKKFQAENLITATLSSQHIPFHLLCVLHAYEAFDAWNLNALKLVQQKFNWRNMVINCTSTVHKFCGKCALSAVIIVLCKLVSNDGHKSSLYMINLKTFSRR